MAELDRRISINVCRDNANAEEAEADLLSSDWALILRVLLSGAKVRLDEALEEAGAPWGPSSGYLFIVSFYGDGGEVVNVEAAACGRAVLPNGLLLGPLEPSSQGSTDS